MSQDAERTYWRLVEKDSMCPRAICCGLGHLYRQGHHITGILASLVSLVSLAYWHHWYHCYPGCGGCYLRGILRHIVIAWEIDRADWCWNLCFVVYWSTPTTALPSPHTFRNILPASVKLLQQHSPCNCTYWCLGGTDTVRMGTLW